MKTLYSFFVTLACLAIGFSANAQTTTAKTTTTKSPTATTSTQQAGLSAKAKALCKSWKFTQSEVFSNPANPTDAQKGDMLVLMDDGRYRWIYNGNVQVGVWTIDKANVYMSFVSDDGTTKTLIKVISSDDSNLKIDYKDADGIHNFLIYQAAK